MIVVAIIAAIVVPAPAVAAVPAAVLAAVAAPPIAVIVILALVVIVVWLRGRPVLLGLLPVVAALALPLVLLPAVAVVVGPPRDGRCRFRGLRIRRRRRQLDRRR